MFKTATIFIKPEADEIEAVAADVATLLSEQGAQVLCCSDTAIKGTQAVTEDNIPYKNNLAVVLGGDGTLLITARKLYNNSSPILGLNLGHRGFLTEMDIINVRQHIQAAFAGNLTIEERPYFLATLTRGTKNILKGEPFINDTVIQRDAAEKMLHFSVTVGEQFMTANRADGIIVSTPTGSTAYNLSTGGPILHPAVSGLVLSPICPHTLSYSPVVIPSTTVDITLDSEYGHLSLDGGRPQNLKKGDRLNITQSENTFRLLHNPKRNFFDLLRTKLGWDKG